jgi:hypothetical protein
MRKLLLGRWAERTGKVRPIDHRAQLSRAACRNALDLCQQLDSINREISQ